MFLDRVRGEGKPLTPQRKLKIVAARLNQLQPGWKLAGDRILGPGTGMVRLGREHYDDPRHIDVDFVLDVDDPERTTLEDCCSAPNKNIKEALTRAVGMWAETTASAGLELMTQRGQFAGHFDGDEPAAFPGWHLIAGGIAGWGVGPDLGAAQQWIVDAKPWVTLAPVMSDALDRDRVNGVKLFIAGSAHNAIAEVRINGVPHQPSSRALLELDWPRVPQGSVARTFLLLI